MPKGHNADGSKKARPVGSGRKAKGGKKIAPKLQQDVIDILAMQPNQASYIEEAIREKFAREQDAQKQSQLQADLLARQLEETRRTGQLDLLDLIEEVKLEKTDDEIAETVNELPTPEPFKSAFQQQLDDIRERQIIRQEQEKEELDAWLDMPAFDTWKEIQGLLKDYSKRKRNNALFIRLRARMEFPDWKRSWRCWLDVVNEKGKEITIFERKASAQYVAEIMHDPDWKVDHKGGNLTHYLLPVNNPVNEQRPKVVKPKPPKPTKVVTDGTLASILDTDVTLPEWMQIPEYTTDQNLEALPEKEELDSDPSYLINLIGADTDINLSTLI